MEYEEIEKMSLEDNLKTNKRVRREHGLNMIRSFKYLMK